MIFFLTEINFFLSDLLTLHADMRYVRWIVPAIVLLLLVAWGGMKLLEKRWAYVLLPAKEMEPYPVGPKTGDSLRVLMIGDSWAGLHHESGCDPLMTRLLADAVGGKAVFEANGRGGAKSGGIYRLMFRQTAPAADMRHGFCTQPQIERRPDYCIVMAGINDAAANYGTEAYCTNYRHILQLLLSAGIRPVVVEMPFVDIWKWREKRPFKDFVVDCLRSLMTDCKMYDVRPYSEALLDSLAARGLAGKVLTVRKEQWNADGADDSRGLYLADRIHLNARGYAALDSCLAATIAADWKSAGKQP